MVDEYVVTEIHPIPPTPSTPPPLPTFPRAPTPVDVRAPQASALHCLKEVTGQMAKSVCTQRGCAVCA